MKKRPQKAKNKVSSLQLVFILILLMVVSATLLRINNVKMIKRRDAVMSADKKNSPIELEERLKELQNFTYSHMNANTGPFFLEHTYQREAQKMIDAVNANDDSDEDKYAQIRQKCDSQKKRGGLRLYINCYKTEMNKIGSSNSNYDTKVKVKMPNINLYRQDYSSPAFSFDWAGLSVIATIIVAIILVKRIIVSLVTIAIIKIKTDKNS